MSAEVAGVRSRRDSRDQALAMLVVGAFGGVWRCRLELGLVGALVGVQLVLAPLVGEVAAGALVLAVCAALLAVPASRRWLVLSLIHI